MSEGILDVGQHLPDVRLPTTEGDVVQTSDFRQRRNLVLALIGRSGCEDFLRDLASRREDFDFLDSDVLVVTSQTPQRAAEMRRRLALPYPMLVDAGGAAHAQLGAAATGAACSPTVYVVDRFGEIFATYPYEDERSVPSAQALLDWLQYIELQCPE